MRISDWSSDVCSSDLVEIIIAVICFGRASGDGHDAGNAEWISFAVVVSENSRISAFIADRYHVPARLGNPEVQNVCPSSIQWIIGHRARGGVVPAGGTMLDTPGRARKRRIGNGCVSTWRSGGEP